MADKDYSQLTSATTAADSDLIAIYPNGGPLKKLTWATFKTLFTSAVSSTFLNAANNLSDVISASAARANLGLGSAATLASSALFQVANNLSEVANATAARTNLGALAATNPDYTGGATGNVSASSSTTISVATAPYHTRSISANTTFTLSGATASKASGMILELTISSSAVPTFTGARWANGAQQTLANGTHLLGLLYNGSTWTVLVLAESISVP